MSSLSCNSSSNHCKNLLDNTSNYFQSNNQSNEYLLIDFKDKKINLKGYSIKSYTYNPNSHNFKSWKVFGSNDQNNWF